MYKKERPTIHFVGIGGSGMNGLAQILLSQGCNIQGSDIAKSSIVQGLEEQGAKVFQGHSESNITESVSGVVVSTAIKGDNPEIKRAHELHIPVIHRAEMLAEVMRLKYSVCVAGTHGKTTTTSVLGSILMKAGVEPTVFVGGLLKKTGTFGTYGEGNWVIAESDESDGSFMKLYPTIAIVTNIDNDHLDHYKDFENLKKTFQNFLNRLPFYGRAVVCGDDPNIQTILEGINRPVYTYGLQEDNDFIARNISVEKGFTRFEVQFHEQHLGDFLIPLFGNHNVLNSLACIATCTEMEVEIEQIRSGLESFEGVDRRFTFRGHFGGAEVFDDYGHHPTEIQAVLQAAKSYKRDGKVVAVFQPHRFTRTRDVLAQFGRCFAMADEIILLPIYSAGEEPISGIDSHAIFNVIKGQIDRDAHLVENFEACQKLLKKIVGKSDMILCLGAGSITKFASEIAD